MSQKTPESLTPALSRRGFLRAAGQVSSGLLLGFFLPLPGCSSPPISREDAFLAVGASAVASLPEARWLNAWIRIGAQGAVTLRIPSSEMGQGSLTSLAQILAEELEVPFQRVRAEEAPVHDDYCRSGPMGKTMVTGGSESVKGYFLILRKAGAAARTLLIEEAAARLGVPSAECTAKDGQVQHAGSGKSLPYAELVEGASKRTPPDEPVLKAPERFTVIGTSPSRLDLLEKVTGKAIFGVDVVVPGMVYACIKASPVFGGALKSVEEGDLAKTPGFIQRVDLEDAVAVVSSSWWQAKKAVEALKVTFDPRGNETLSTAGITERFMKGLESPGRTCINEGEPEEALAEAGDKVIEATYEVPYLAHVPMEPSACTVKLEPTRCDVWIATQAPDWIHKLAVELTRLKPEQVFVHRTYLGGGFGRKAEKDYARQAILIAQAVGKPVKLLWTREEDFAHDFYRPAAASKLKATLGSDGLPRVWFQRSISQQILERLMGETTVSIVSAAQRLTGPTIDAIQMEGTLKMPYTFPNRRIELVDIRLPVPVGFWRSVGHSYNGFFVECFLDELAHVAGQDPMAYRLTLMKDHPRDKRLLEAVAEASSWGKAPEGRFQGVAHQGSFGSLVSMVAEIGLTPQGRLRVHKITVGVDCGRAIHPDNIKAQLEGGVGFGLSAFWQEAITLEGGAVQQKNLGAYPLMPLKEMPEVSVVILESPEEALGGIGEVGVPPVAPAVLNAWFKATGKRVRKLPFEPVG